MAKRERNWQPDIYDMTARRMQPAAKALVVADAPGDSEAATQIEPDAALPADEVTDLGVARPVAVGVVAPTPAGRASDNEALLGLVAGAVVGAALTLLIAPASGARLRAQLRARVDTSIQMATNQAQALAQKMPNSLAAGPETPAPGEQKPIVKEKIV